MNLIVIILIVLVSFLIIYKYENFHNIFERKEGGNEEEVAEFLYLCDGGRFGFSTLYIPEKDFNNKTIEDIFKQYEISCVQIEKESDPLPEEIRLAQDLPVYQSRYEKLFAFSKANKKSYLKELSVREKYTHIKNLNELYTQTKNIIKKFLPVDTDIINFANTTKFHCKGDEIQKRMTSFNYLRQVVNSKPEKFSKIKFPNRYMAIKKVQAGVPLFHKNSNPILNREESSKYIDENFKLVLQPSGQITWTIDNPEYVIIMCSTFVPHNKEHPFLLSEIAKNQLIELLKIAPFDTSYNTSGNVFAVGDEAWIVDGKNKGSESKPMIDNVLEIK